MHIERSHGGCIQAGGAGWVVGGGEMGRLIREMDWSRTALGPIGAWPQSLRSAVSILLPSRAQIALFWGPDLVTLYNDAYRPVFGGKHPGALGLPIRESWSELWAAGLKELFEGVLATGEAYWASDRPFFMERHGFLEETFFDVSYDPVRDETGGVGGVFCIVSETTGRVVGERRLKTLHGLSASATAQARSVSEAGAAAVRTLAENRHDLPFSLLYLLGPGGDVARLAGCSGLGEGSAAAPEMIGLGDGAAFWPLGEAMRAGGPVEVRGLASRIGATLGAVWPEPVDAAVVQPMGGGGAQDRCAGFLVAGVSPRRVLDGQYRGFVALLANQIGTAVANARAHEEERQRAESLAALDRAKTAFFSNVSHELRTPLTLILGPVEDALQDAACPLAPAQRERLEIALRNSLRLQRLVNTLLDFSRIEAGRVQARYEPVHLATLTSDLASNFRSACERAGLELVVDCPPLSEPVYVDREMWEKVVLNLLSNAFKFTLEGRIELTLRRAGRSVELTVRDTGVGIAPEELPRLFERFYRVEGSRGRSQEGTGIGLALVRELVKLHGGGVRAESRLGEGSTFVVSIPLGTGHLPAERIGAARAETSTALGAAPFVEEALRWLPDGAGLPGAPSAGPDGLPAAAREGGAGRRARILVADDNADMRDYLARMLGEWYDVVCAGDGASALAVAGSSAPDLILADVMMPGLDGFALVRELRADERLGETPVILLSARAGEEARIEGLGAGADDYMVKPFSARELVARVQGQLALVDLRRRSRRALVELVGARTAELEASHERLRLAERMASLGTLAAGLGHDMGNLLLPMRVRIESLEAMGLPEGCRADLAGIRAGLEYLRNLSGGLRLLSLDSDGEWDPTELRSWWAEARNVLRSALPGGVELRGEFAEGEWRVTMAAPALTQAALNLVQNAGEALRGRSGGTVTVSAERRDGCVRVVVADDGPGMPEEVRAHCMEPFFTTKSRSVSTGLGLSLVYGLVRRAGGSVEVTSAPGVGTKFVLNLPEAPPPAPARERRRVAVVDVKNDRYRAIITNDLRMASFDALGPESIGDAELVVTDDAREVPAGRGVVIALAEPPEAPEGAIVLGRRPSVRALREAIHAATRERAGEKV